MKPAFGRNSLVLIIFTIISAFGFGHLAEGAQLPVGFGGAYSRPCEAIAVARAGDVIELDGKGVWVDDFCPITAPGVTVRSVGGGRARVAASGRVELAEGKGIWVIRAAGVTIEGVELVGVHTRGGAGIWVEDGYGLILRQSRIVGHARGVVSGGGGEPVVVERSEIGGNTLHNLDIGGVARLELRGNYVYRSGRGALVRSRAREQELEANRLTQESGGGPVQVELLGGGLAKVRGNVIQQQRGEGVLLGWEGTSGSGLWVVNNTLVNEGDGGTFVRVGGEAAGIVVLRNNLFVGAGEVTNREEVEQSHNYVGDEAGFVDREGLDYRLKAESEAVNAGAEAGKVGDEELAPGWQYVHVGCLESRVSRGVIDLGAYEYGGGGGEGCGSDPLGVAERSVAEGGKKRSGEGLAAEAPSDLGLQLESGTVTAGGSVTLGLRLTGTTPATGLSWKLLYPPASVSGVQMAAGAVASAAGKTLTCQNSSGAVRCLLIGVNTTALANGEVARATLQFAAGATGTVAIQVTEALGTSAAGDTMAVYGVVDAQVTVVSAVAVSVTPATASLTASQTQQFAATVTGTTNTAVTWSRSPAVGTISTSGLYTAPASITSQQTITITATSAADPTKTATATVTLVPVVAVSVSPTAASLTASQTQQFAATVTGTTNTAVTWSRSPAVGTISTSGLYTAPASITSQQTITITATSAADPTKTATATVTLVPVVAVAVSPATASLTASQTQQFAATVTGTTNTAVTWSRSPAVGTISTSGLYTAPASITSQQTITITATSAADPTKTATATVTLVPVVAVSVSPATASLTASQTQQFAATVTGTTNTAVTWSRSPAVGTISTSGLYTAPASITSQQTITITATSAADTTKTATATVTLVPVVAVSVSPTAASLTASQTQQFAATVTGTTNTAVTWSRSPAVGTISTSGLYTAPASITSQQTITITATSAADPTKTATATVTLVPVVAVSVSPATASLTASQTQQFAATVTGTTNTAVTWSRSPAVGTISTSGLYTAPASITSQQTITITATSTADTTKSATAVVTLTPPAGGTVFNPIRVNSGGVAFTDMQGRAWAADTGFLGGSTYSTTTEVAGADAPPLYRSERWSSTTLQYEFAVPAGSYQVTLKFAEIFFSSAGQRIFHIDLNGQRMAANFDPFAAAEGAFKAVDRRFTVSPVGDKITIQLVPVVSNPKISGIEIITAPVAVLVTPPTVSLAASQTQQFAATVTGTTNTAVTWSLSPAVGTISTSGLYTAPASITSQQTVTITATSAADITKTATAVVTLVPPVALSVTPITASLFASQTQQFAATVTGTTNTAVTWSLSPAVGTISTSGLYTAPASITSQQTITITATSAADTTKTATATVTLVPVVAVSVSPATASLTASQTQQFAATVTGTTNTAVTWSRSPAVGTISTSGLYTAPASITSQQTITITATSTADTTKSATAVVTLTPPAGGTVFNPIRVNSGGVAFTDMQGRAWAADTGFLGGSTYSTTTEVAGADAPPLYRSERWSSTTLQYEFAVPAGSYQVTLKFAEIFFSSAGQRIFHIDLNGQRMAANFDPFAAAEGAFKAVDRRFTVSPVGDKITIQLVPVVSNPKISGIEIITAPVAVLVTPPTVSLAASQTQQFAATVTGTTNTAVTWSRSPAVGTISTSGLYTAPASITSQQTITITATSAADTTKSATAVVTLTPPAGGTAFNPIRVNSGGVAFTDALGRAWAADTGFLGGSTYSTTTEVTGADAPPLYRSERWSSTTLQYEFAVPAGSYQVTLKFAEIFFSSAGQRIFHIDLNGQRMAANFDPVAAAGGAFKAVDRRFTVSPVGGKITIQLVPVVSNPKISGIEIITAPVAVLAIPPAAPVTRTANMGKPAAILAVTPPERGGVHEAKEYSLVSYMPSQMIRLAFPRTEPPLLCRANQEESFRGPAHPVSGYRPPLPRVESADPPLPEIRYC